MNPPATGVRRRPGHKSCEGCQVAKRRCERERHDVPCERCRTLGLECKMPARRPRKERTGRRLELAKDLFGGANDASTRNSGSSSETGRSSPEGEGQAETPDGPQSDDGLPVGWSAGYGEADSTTFDERARQNWMAEGRSPDDAGLSNWREEFEDIEDNIPPDWSGELYLSHLSPESTLSTDEMRSETSSQLIEEYFIVSQFPMPHAGDRWRSFRDKFEQAGRRPEQLPSPITQVYAAVLIAKGARVTSAPYALGRTITALELERGDLTEYGRRRQEVCETLTESAVKLADASGVFRQESSESIVILMMLSNHLDHNDPSRSRGRPYRVAAAAHARSIAENGQGGTKWYQLIDVALASVLYIHDTWTSVSSGRTANLVETDERLVYGTVMHALPTVDDLRDALNGEKNIFLPSGMMWAYLTKQVRHVDSHLRRGPHSPEVLAVLEETYSQLDEYKNRFQSMWSILGQFFLAKRPGYNLIKRNFATCPFPYLLLNFYVHRSIKVWVETPLIYDAILPEMAASLRRLKLEADQRMGQCARDMAQLFGIILDMLPSRVGLPLVPGMVLMYETLPVWAEFLIAIPISDNGATTPYTLEAKREEMEWLLEALYSFGWSHADDSLVGSIALIKQCLSATQDSPRTT